MYKLWNSTFVFDVSLPVFGLDIVDDDLVQVGFVGDQGRVAGGFSHIWDKPGLATK